MEERLRPIVKDNKIINLKEVLLGIRECSDLNLLNAYLEEVKDYSSYNLIDGLDKLDAALSVRLDQLSNKNNIETIKEEPIKEVITITKDIEPQPELKTVSIVDANNIIALYFNNVTPTKEQENKIQEFISNGLTKMESEEIDFEYQNTIDIYIVYLENKANLTKLTKEEINILNSYLDIIRKREENILEKEDSLSEVHQLKLVPKNLNTNGAVVTVVILEVTILLGILISAVALVKR